MQTWTWPQVWRRRLERHWLLQAAARHQMLDVVGDVCGIHAQVAASADLSLALRVQRLTRQDVRRCLIEDRTLVKTYGLRGTLHVFPARELGLWLAALRARPPLRLANRFELDAFPPERRGELLNAIHVALDGRPLTRDELEAEIERHVGGWATEAVFPAFGGHWPRWQLWLRQAAVEGLVVFGPNQGNRVTYVRTDRWLGQLPEVDGQAALSEVCRRYFAAYGPATHVEFARWFYTKPRAALELMRSIDLDEVEVEGWRAWLPRGESTPDFERPSFDSVHLLPHYDCYVVGSHPRSQLVPAAAPAALHTRGTAAPFNVVLVNGVVGGLWERRRHANVLDVRVDTFAALSKAQRSDVERQAARIGEILETPVELSFGPVAARPHL
jgi:hypothetical protein